jgi:hypothetical protein
MKCSLDKATSPCPPPRTPARTDANLIATMLVGVSAAAGAQTTPPTITAAPSPDVVLQTGPPADAFWVNDNRWGQGRLRNGTFTQEVGVWDQYGPGGEVAWRMRWTWPQGNTEVKGYPAAIHGAKPGHYSTNWLFAGAYEIRLPDKSLRTEAPTSGTPGTRLPMRLPLTGVKAKGSWQHAITPTGQGQLTYDLWLQSNARQDSRFAASSITHEIMVPLSNWGNYGAHNVPGGRNPAWFDHDAVIDGRLWHIYITKGADGCWRYDFGSLTGTYGKTGWKMIAFLPDQPVTGEIDFAALVNYMIGRKDACGQNWAEGNEYLVSSELGVEPVVGSGDITVYDHKFMVDASAPAPTPAPAPAPSPSPSPTPAPSPAPAPSCSSAAPYRPGTRYMVGNVVSYQGGFWVAIQSNFRNIAPTPENSAYWSSLTC